jgi:hypothetical protein
LEVYRNCIIQHLSCLLGLTTNDNIIMGQVGLDLKMGLRSRVKHFL